MGNKNSRFIRHMLPARGDGRLKVVASLVFPKFLINGHVEPGYPGAPSNDGLFCC